MTQLTGLWLVRVPTLDSSHSPARGRCADRGNNWGNEPQLFRHQLSIHEARQAKFDSRRAGPETPAAPGESSSWGWKASLWRSPDGMQPCETPWDFVVDGGSWAEACTALEPH